MPLSSHKVHALRESLLRRAKESVSEQLSGPDLHVVRAVSSMKSLESILNLMAEQTYDWYSVHFPEFRGLFRDPMQGIQLIAALGDRSRFSKEAVGKIVQDDSLSARILSASQASMGGAVPASTLKMVQRLAALTLSVRDEYSFLQGFIVNQMRELAPNFTELATPSIGAQLLSKAGSLHRLAEMPASTIQVLGAEEALFSHIKSKTRSPKHGFIFNHPYIKTLPKHGRGKMARALAGKLAICIRVDVFGKSRVVDDYKPKLEALSKKLSKEKGPAFKRTSSR